MKPKYDIYIRTDLRERFDKEPNKSGLVNELLAAHYNGKAPKAKPTRKRDEAKAKESAPQL